ncbi:trans-3-hydroxy-L-proline dehydratase [Stakelama pacifica]|uniref:Proline racemase n=1 Tax=Stakelama pacifica TaxID=517720 RepID=A0A4R6FAW7_9SPHN|nr:proline racemase family protein [Stakelama pacifica]TDN78256.1 proline racemase [Stakelama pacifica]GGO99788.1 putative trans-3-hydroxy-L-proline dehydratase [Stakelama pacifica]
MRPSDVVKIVNCHAAGEVGDVIVGGIEAPPGETIREQARWVATDQGLRDYVLNEPRGGVFRHVNLLVPPIDPRADAGWIVMEPEDTPLMSGSNSMCVATVLLETGRIRMIEPETIVRLEAPGGLVEILATCRDGRVVEVRTFNLPSFTARLDAYVEVSGLGTVQVDVAFGGDSFAIVDAHKLGFGLDPSEALDLARVGIAITNAANEQIGFVHPEKDWSHISFCQIAAPLFVEDGVPISLNAVAIQPGKIDRSPCGTGCSARMAVLSARGLLRVGDRMIGRSIIGGRFDCKIEEDVDVAGLRAIIPSIAGRAWITGTQEHRLDETDPWPRGYRLTDTWPQKQ